MDKPGKKTHKNKHVLNKQDDHQFDGLHLDRQSEDGRVKVYKNNEGEPDEALLVFEA